MNPSEKLTANYRPADEICTIIIPGWPSVPPVEARTDGKNEITIVVTKGHEQEKWRLVRLRKGKLCAIVYLARKPQDTGRFERVVYDLVVRVPPERLETIRVFTSDPDSR